MVASGEHDRRPLLPYGHSPEERRSPRDWRLQPKWHSFRRSGRELYDPTNNTWTQTGNLNTARYDHAASELPNGRVLVAGGYAQNGAGYLASTELYNSTTGLWTQTAAMHTPRRYATATLLANGKVLVAGGDDGNDLASAEVYTPTTSTWSITASMNAPRRFHSAVTLKTGNVMIIGGESTSPASSRSAEMYVSSP